MAAIWAVCNCNYISVPEAATMFKSTCLLLALLISGALPVVAFAAGKHPADMWNYYHFDGVAFTPGQATDGSAFVAVREKLRPVVLTAQVTDIEKIALPDETGVIAGICYIQSSGGKLGNGSSYKPFPHVPLQIFSGDKEFVTVQTDDNGYFIAALPAGNYSVGSGTFTAKITVERGVTTLVPLRVGKRMVD